MNVVHVIYGIPLEEHTFDASVAGVILCDDVPVAFGVLMDTFDLSTPLDVRDINWMQSDIQGEGFGEFWCALTTDQKIAVASIGAPRVFLYSPPGQRIQSTYAYEAKV